MSDPTAAHKGLQSLVAWKGIAVLPPPYDQPELTPGREIQSLPQLGTCTTYLPPFLPNRHLFFNSMPRGQKESRDWTDILESFQFKTTGKAPSDFFLK